MSCETGARSFASYKEAVLRRNAARDRLLQAAEPKDAYERVLFQAERRYSKALVAWVTHRGFCIGCRATSVREDLAQFASV